MVWAEGIRTSAATQGYAYVFEKMDGTWIQTAKLTAPDGIVGDSWDFKEKILPENINTIMVYPNPAKDHIFINTGNFGLIYDYRLKIIDQVGVTVFETYARDFIYDVNL